MTIVYFSDFSRIAPPHLTGFRIFYSFFVIFPIYLASFPPRFFKDCTVVFYLLSFPTLLMIILMNNVIIVIFFFRFFKDCTVVFVIIDDKIPVKAKDGRPIFGHAKDPNELWVCLVEKGKSVFLYNTYCKQI